MTCEELQLQPPRTLAAFTTPWELNLALGYRARCPA
jgi:hypothetical protein